MMEFTATQEQTIREWAAEGCGLSEIQRRIQSEFGMALTYMDVRFLVIEKGIELKDKAEARAAAPDAAEAPAGAGDTAVADASMDDSGEDTAFVDGELTLSVDRVMQPGAMASGQVKFSDGRAGRWFLDATGRLGLDVGDPEYRPSAKDVQAFQIRLQEVLASRGY